jgi:hypothetical protein
MGLFSGIGKAIGGVLGGVSNAIGGALGALGPLKALLDSPLGSLLAGVFPPAAGVMGVLQMAGMFGNLAGSVGGGQDYM